jgi:hypothetical protein
MWLLSGLFSLAVARAQCTGLQMPVWFHNMEVDLPHFCCMLFVIKQTLGQCGRGITQLHEDHWRLTSWSHLGDWLPGRTSSFSFLLQNLSKNW